MNKPKNNHPTQKDHIIAYLEILDCEKKMQTHQESDLLLAQLAYIYNDVIFILVNVTKIKVKANRITWKI